MDPTGLVSNIIDSIEKTLLKQRFTNLSAGQGGYIEKQKKALTN